MEKKVILLASIALVIIVVSLLINQGILDYTGASIAGQKKCLNPKAALTFINERGCTRIYEDPKCEEQGKVEVQC